MEKSVKLKKFEGRENRNKITNNVRNGRISPKILQKLKGEYTNIVTRNEHIAWKRNYEKLQEETKI